MTKSRGNRKDILFGNNNGTIIQRLIVNRLKSSRQRNLFVIFAVVLTTALFTAFFLLLEAFWIRFIKRSRECLGQDMLLLNFYLRGSMRV